MITPYKYFYDDGKSLFLTTLKSWQKSDENDVSLHNGSFSYKESTNFAAGKTFKLK